MHKLSVTILLCCLAVVLGGLHQATAEVQWTIQKKLQLESEPVDLAVSESGKSVYILTEAGEVLVYAADGELEGTIDVGKQVTSIEAGPSDDLLIVGSSEDNSVRIISLEFVHEIDISGAPALGPPDAMVTVAVFMDYQCPYCARLEPVLEQVLAKYPEQVKIVYKQYPLKMHKAALSAAEASLVAAREGRFRELHTLLHDDFKDMTEESILDKASSLGFDREAFQKEMASPTILLQIQKDMEDGKKAGVSGIPSVFINGKRLKNRSLDGFEKMIDQELITF